MMVSPTEQLLQSLTVGDEREDASHQLSSWSGKLSLPTAFPFLPMHWHTTHRRWQSISLL